MDCLHRLKQRNQQFVVLVYCILVLLFCLVYSCTARAETIAATHETQSAQALYSVTDNQFPQGPGSDRQALCDALRQAKINVGAGPFNPATITNPAPGQCRIQFTSGFLLTYNFSSNGNGCPSGWTLSGSICERYTCPATGGWTLSGTDCTRSDCQAGQTRDGSGNCSCPSAGTSISGASAVYGLSGYYSGTTFCLLGCTVSADGGSSRGRNASGQWRTEWYGPFDATGTTCTAGSGGAPPPPTGGDAPQCPAGQCMGTINGVSICVSCSQTERHPPPSTESGSTTTPGSPGSTSTSTETSQTTCGPTGCTTTTTTTTTTQPRDSSGNPTGSPTTTTTTRTEPGQGNEISEFCETHPDSPMCTQSSWGGSCGAFACDGDAIQCAIAQEIYKRNCELLDPDSGFTKANAATSFNDTRSFDAKKLNASTVAFDSLDRSAFLASGGLQDQSYQIMGSSVTFHFSALNSYLGYVGLVFMVVCGVIAFRIVAGGVA